MYQKEKNIRKTRAKKQLNYVPHPIQPLATLVKTDARGSVGEGGRFNFFLFHFIYTERSIVRRRS